MITEGFREMRGALPLIADCNTQLPALPKQSDTHPLTLLPAAMVSKQASGTGGLALVPAQARLNVCVVLEGQHTESA